MAAKPHVTASPKEIRDMAVETTRQAVVIDASKGAVAEKPQDPKVKAAKKAGKKAGKKRAKMQLYVPAIVLLKLKIASALAGKSPRQFVIDSLQEPLRQFQYPPMPEWIKEQGDSEDEVSAAA